MPMKRLRTFLLLMILLVLGNGVFAESSKKVSVKRILIIDSFSSLDTWTNELKQGLKSYGYLYLFKDKLRYGWQKKEYRSIYSYEQYWRRTC